MRHMKRIFHPVRWTLVCGAAMAVCTFPVLSASLSEARSFADMSLEELGNIEIISVSRKPERLADAAAAVFVITSEDIRRSGAVTLPEALRLAPNLHVAQASASAYAISARGANGSNSSAPNKLLVMIDGRSIYSPLFSGVFWDVQDVMLEDVERIEVISGPGGTLWGANAVNGVINIITRSPGNTQGGLVEANAGNRRRGAAFRYGGKIAEDGSYRIYGKHSVHNDMSTFAGSAADDGWHKSQVGFRADWDRPGEQFMVQGNAYRARVGQPKPGSISIDGTDLALGTISASGVNLTTRWAHLLGDGSNLSLQAYYDRTERTVPPTFSVALDIVDMQLQHSLVSTGIHALAWGVNYRYSWENVRNTSNLIAFLPAHVNQKWASLFAQDEITLRQDLRLTLGARVERNDYTGNEFLPNVRLAWKAAPDHLLWTSASRTVRAPSRLDRDVFSPASAPFLLAGGPDVRSEVAKVFELGYRGQLTPRVSYSATAFHTVYEDVRTQEIAPSRTFLVFGNGMEGKTTGIEMWGVYQASTDWRLSAGYTALNERLWLKPGSNDVAGPNATGKNPAHMWQLRSSLAVGQNRELDIGVRRVAALSNPGVPAYTAIDARFGWKLRPDLELSIIGQNLFGTDHAEYGALATRSEIPTGVFVRLLWQL
jgi:iron complex outermembrane receptor protein